MRILQAATCLASCIAAVQAQWSFTDGKVAIQGRGAGVGTSSKQEVLKPSSAVSSQLSLGPTDTLKVTLITTDDNSPKRPHQAFLTLREPTTGLEESFPLAVKDTGRAKVEFTQKDLPIQLLTSSQSLKASIVLAAFGSSVPYKSPAFEVTIKSDPSQPIQAPEKPVRYGKLEAIHHTFRADARSPPRIITLVFTVIALATLPILFISWISLGANLNQLSEAFGTAPVSHGLFFGSIIAMEGIFLLYYSHWTLFQMLPPATAAATVAFLSGSRALSEVQERRLAGKR